MKRDMELVRKILLAVESWPPEGGDLKFETLGGPSPEIEYNCYQAIKGGLLDGDYSTADEIMTVVFGLTPAGHDFLDNARNQFVWDDVMAEIKKKGMVSASVDVVKRLLNKQIKKHLELD